MNTTIKTKAIINGRMPIFNILPSWSQRLFPDEVVSSFCTSKVINTNTPTKANEPAIADVVKIVTVDVVTVEIIKLPHNHQ